MPTEDILRYTIEHQRERFAADHGVPVFDRAEGGEIKVGIACKDDTRSFEDWLLLLNNPEILAEIGYLPKHQVKLRRQDEDKLMVEFYLVGEPEQQMLVTISEKEPGKMIIESVCVEGDCDDLKALLRAIEFRVQGTGSI